MQKLCSLHKQVMKIVIIPFHNLTTIAFFASNNITRPKSSVVTAKRPFGANVMLLPWRRESGKPNLTVERIKPKKNQMLTFKTFLSVKLTEDELLTNLACSEVPFSTLGFVGFVGSVG